MCHAWGQKNPPKTKNKRSLEKKNFFFIATATATATWDPSHVCDLYHSSWQCRILNPLCKARDWTCILMDPRQVWYHWATMGNPERIILGGWNEKMRDWRWEDDIGDLEWPWEGYESPAQGRGERGWEWRAEVRLWEMELEWRGPAWLTGEHPSELHPQLPVQSCFLEPWRSHYLPPWPHPETAPQELELGHGHSQSTTDSR